MFVIVFPYSIFESFADGCVLKICWLCSYWNLQVHVKEFPLIYNLFSYLHCSYSCIFKTRCHLLTLCSLALILEWSSCLSHLVAGIIGCSCHSYLGVCISCNSWHSSWILSALSKDSDLILKFLLGGLWLPLTYKASDSLFWFLRATPPHDSYTLKDAA